MQTITKKEQLELTEIKSRISEYLDNLKEENKSLNNQLGFNKVSNIFQSTNYDLFQFFDGNRPLKTHIKKIVKSIEKYGNLTIGLVAKFKNKYYILDGQHRFTTCKEMNIPFEFKLIDITEKDDILRIISALNSTSAKWSGEDYLNGWATEGKRAYIKLAELRKKYPKIRLSAMQVVFKYKTDVFEGGLWKLRSFKKGETILSQIDELIPLMYEEGKFNIQPMRALIKVMNHKGYKHSQMVEIAKNNKGGFFMGQKDLLEQLSQFLQLDLEIKK